MTTTRTTPGAGALPLPAPIRLIAAASAFVGVRERGTSNSGEMVDLFLAGTRLAPGQPWCAAFVSHVGYWSHADPSGAKSSWPLPRTASCWMLGDAARRMGMLAQEPQAGDVFLVYSAERRRFAHTGIVVEVCGRDEAATTPEWYECVTIEGNTNEAGSREGTSVLRRKRKLRPVAGDRFVRWVRAGAGQSA